MLFSVGRMLVHRRVGHEIHSGQVGEWLKPTDCKSVPPCEVRRFESFPVHHPRLPHVPSELKATGRCSSAGRALPW
jgi:hypothetical protein